MFHDGDGHEHEGDDEDEDEDDEDKDEDDDEDEGEDADADADDDAAPNIYPVFGSSGQNWDPVFLKGFVSRGSYFFNRLFKGVV